jgi:regulator of protease activity HflC (stomatin/prohibitin superfamily)
LRDGLYFKSRAFSGGRPRGPGIIFVIPILERAVRIDLRTVTLDIPPQDVITRDNVTMKVSAVLYFR